MVKFKCEECGTEFSIGDDIFDMLMPYCPCCMAQDLVKNVIKDGEKMEKWKLEDLDKAINKAFGFTNPYTFKTIGEIHDNYESEDKNVSHPSHYQSDNGIEVIDVIEAFTNDLKGIEATDTGNVIKYICRWKKKNGTQDLEKAMWYLQHLLNHVRGKEK